MVEDNRLHDGDYEKVKARGAGLYAIDKNKPQRKSHENEDIKKLYDEFLGDMRRSQCS